MTTPNMTILESSCKLIKWMPTAEDEFESDCKGGETIGVRLLKTIKFPIVFHMTAYIHFTCENTNYLLDVESLLAQHLSFANNKIQAWQLYDAYIMGRKDWITEIEKEARKRGYKQPIPAIHLVRVPFEVLKPELEKQIYLWTEM